MFTLSIRISGPRLQQLFVLSGTKILALSDAASPRSLLLRSVFLTDNVRRKWTKQNKSKKFFSQDNNRVRLTPTRVGHHRRRKIGSAAAPGRDSTRRLHTIARGSVVLRLVLLKTIMVGKPESTCERAAVAIRQNRRPAPPPSPGTRGPVVVFKFVLALHGWTLWWLLVASGRDVRIAFCSVDRRTQRRLFYASRRPFNSKR